MHALRSALLCALLTLPAQGRTLIEAAYEQGALDLETALLYQVLAARDPDALPAAYQQAPARPFCATPHLVQARQASAHLSPDYGRRLAKVLARPSLSFTHMTPSGRFRIHYDTTGQRGVDPADASGNGVPDYVDRVAAVLDSVWILEVETLKYNPPPPDGGLGGGAEYDVYIVDLGRGGAYGFTYPETGGTTSHSYLELDNNYTDPIYQQTHGLDALRVTVAHEFFHALQFGYYQGSDGIWWQESSSTWMEEVAYPHIDDYLQYLPSFLGQPERSLDSGNRFSSDFHIYGTSIFAHFLDQRYERDMVRWIWEELGRRKSARFEHFDRAIRQSEPAGLAEAMSEFATWNYFTGARHRSGFYQEGDKYPVVRARDIDLDIRQAAKTTRLDSGAVDHMASTYLRLEPRQTPGGVLLEFSPRRGQWLRKLLLVSRQRVEILRAEEDPLRVPRWDDYTEVVLVLTSVDQTGFAYEYALSVEYDPELTDVQPPEISLLHQTRPNPFHPEAHGQTLLLFDLAEPSQQTALYIYAADGSLVWSRDLGPMPARAKTAVPWDGRNAQGEQVASGLYYYALEVDGRRTARTLALVRGAP